MSYKDLYNTGMGGFGRGVPVLYVTKLADAVYVLHCFQKKTETTSKVDLNLASKRYRDLMKESET